MVSYSSACTRICIEETLPSITVAAKLFVRPPSILMGRYKKTLGTFVARSLCADSLLARSSINRASLYIVKNSRSTFATVDRPQKIAGTAGTGN